MQNTKNEKKPKTKISDEHMRTLQLSCQNSNNFSIHENYSHDLKTHKVLEVTINLFKFCLHVHWSLWKTNLTYNVNLKRWSLENVASFNIFGLLSPDKNLWKCTSLQNMTKMSIFSLIVMLLLPPNSPRLNHPNITLTSC